MRQKWSFLVFLLMIPTLLVAHPLHLSFTNLEFNEAQLEWELTVKVFTDDFQNSLEQTIQYSNPLPKTSRSADFGKVMLQWLGEALSIQFDDRKIPATVWEFESLKTQKDAVLLTVTFKADPPATSLLVRNTILFELFTDQKNLFIFTMGPFQSANQFNKKEPETLIILKQ